MSTHAEKRCPLCCTWHAPRCTATDRTWPTAPLIAAVGSRAEIDRRVGGPMRMPDFVSDLVADRWAVRCGLHPEQVWPGWCEAALTYGDRVFIEEGGWRQSWEWAESQRCDLPAGNPLRGQGDPGTLRGRENANEAAMVARGERVA